MKKEIFQVSASDRDELLALYERQNGLNELAKILTADNSDLYERLVKDLADTSSKSQNWWQRMATEHNWESHPDGHWEIDFQSGTIYLVVNE